MISPAAVRDRLRSRRAQLSLAVVVIIILGTIYALVARGTTDVDTRSQFVAGTPENGQPVKLDTTVYLPPTIPAPGVLLSQGFSGDKRALDERARELAKHGYVVLTYSARGFGRSGGLIHFASPDYEVRDGKLLLDYLSKQPEVRKVDGRAELATAGSSYGGALSLLIAAADPRVQAVAADATWSDLSQALFPNHAVGSGNAPGVFKRLWAGNLFSNALTANTGDGCGRFAPEVCAAYQASAAAGTPDAAMRTLMRRASPATVLDEITAPTLLIQGENDSLFGLEAADTTARGLAAHDTPVRVLWRAGGHDEPERGQVAATTAMIEWFHDAFDGQAGRQQPFRFVEEAGSISAATGDVSQETLEAEGYPGIAGQPRQASPVQLSGEPQSIASPAGGTPSVITQIPGFGALFNSPASVDLPSVPGQTARFASAPLRHDRLVAGQPSVELKVTVHSGHEAVLFAALRDLGPDGASTLPSRLVAPIRLTGLTPGTATTVQVTLPTIVRTVAAGHRLELTVSSTDFAYASPSRARDYTIALGGAGTVSVPTVEATVVRGGHAEIWLIVGGIVCLLMLLGVAVVLVRRRVAQHTIDELADVPVEILGLIKDYGSGYRAVDDVDLRVERGQVVGLLGPNGAGKTTVLRVLVGLITPTAGTVYVFGRPVTPGSAVLARVGAFIEGPGFLPHLTGRENLRLYWAATGRSSEQSQMATALEIAGLGPSIDRVVRTYSHGMKQRLGLAQAMLGLPELLVLDEPTNGLDPPQIAEMREVLLRYAQTGRTVLVSSHLLAEVEQTCTHVVVMHRGKVVTAGPTGEVAGTRNMQLAVGDPDRAREVLAAAGISADLVPARRALEDVFLGLVADDDDG